MSVPALIANVPFQSTLSVRRATTPVGEPQYRPQFQSTLSVRRATRAVPGRVLGATFQSTLSVRRATFFFLPVPPARLHFNPRSP